MTDKKRKACSIVALAVGTFLWDWGLYAMTNEFVAKLFLVIIIISGAWCYYELIHAAVEPPHEDENCRNTKHKNEQS
ncbi:hypothetical protein HMPREF1214_02071 [Bacteroides sp. HPS0048]|uniref:hypothetical protein n=1 Tax=Bacteroides sp. HPS0048 TaxID=1078089 RepID=UPI000374CB8B|nr:hypothetical protein [Bacteroides sp. HPS0048]EOA58499.1 hypothetical protein HMPREF1214_02071 [Bacteroides sp. HPS0048]